MQTNTSGNGDVLVLCVALIVHSVKAATLWSVICLRKSSHSVDRYLPP